MRKGRTLELIVKEIKSVLNPNAEIKSPEYVPDKDTGTKREVDISIRQKLNDDQSIFIAVECRDRGKTEDITWIEQLITKKKSIDADVLIAVTSSSFTKPARVKALKNNILIRNIEQFQPEEVEGLLLVPFVQIMSVSGLNLKNFDSVFCPDINELAKTQDLSNCRFHSNSYPIVAFLKFNNSQNGQILAEYFEFESMMKFIVPNSEDNTLIINFKEWGYSDRIITGISIKQNEVNRISNMRLIGDFKAGTNFSLWGKKFET